MFCNIWSGDGHVDTHGVLVKGSHVLAKRLKLLLSLQNDLLLFLPWIPFGWSPHPTNMKTVPSSKVGYEQFLPWNRYIFVSSSKKTRPWGASFCSAKLEESAVCFGRSAARKKHQATPANPNSPTPNTSQERRFNRLVESLALGFCSGKSHVWRFFLEILGWWWHSWGFFCTEFSEHRKKPRWLFHCFCRRRHGSLRVRAAQPLNRVGVELPLIGIQSLPFNLPRPGSSMVFLSGTQKKAAFPGQGLIV